MHTRVVETLQLELKQAFACKPHYATARVPLLRLRQKFAIGFAQARGSLTAGITYIIELAAWLAAFTMQIRRHLGLGGRRVANLCLALFSLSLIHI